MQWSVRGATLGFAHGSSFHGSVLQNGGSMQFLRNMLFPGGYMPHGTCYLWTPSLIGLHVASDSLIALSFLSIAVTLLVHFIYKRRDIPFSWMFLCFGAFIVACCGMHLMEVWTIWFPSFRLAGALKAVTACAAILTAILLILESLSLLRTLKQDYRTRRTPVIFLTSSKEERDLIASYELGVNGYTQKPVDFDEFREMTRTLTLYWLLMNQPPLRRDLLECTGTPA
jgi:hypothetical protein